MKKRRTIQKRIPRKIKKRSTKRSKRIKKISKRIKKISKKSSRTNQKGSGLLPAIGVGLLATSIAAAAYRGFRLVNKIKDKSYILRLLNKGYIEHAPKVVVTETPDFMNYYLQCVSSYEFFQILLQRSEYLKSKTLQHIIKNTSENERKSKSDMDKSYGDDFSEIDKIISSLHAEETSDMETKLSLRADMLETSNNKNISDLKNLLLLTARIPGSNIEDNVNIGRIVKITPYITVSSFKWMNVIITGLYDEYFDGAVNEILDDRNISESLDVSEKERIQSIIESLSDNENLKSAIHKKMMECSSKPRGYLDYVSSTIS
jgi:hypothetical protein